MSTFFSSTLYHTGGDDANYIYEEIDVNAAIKKKDRKNTSPGQRKPQQVSTDIPKKVLDRHNAIGPGQSNAKYMGILESAGPSSLQKSRLPGPEYSAEFRGVHSDEANDTYSYAMSKDMVRKLDQPDDDFTEEQVVNVRQKARQSENRVTSLQDGNFKPMDGGKLASHRRQKSLDYLETYAVKKAGIATDTGGIYSLAKDVEHQPQMMHRDKAENETDDTYYDHLSETTAKVSLVNYDHVTVLSDHVKPHEDVDNALVICTNAHHHSDISLPKHKYVNVCVDDVKPYASVDNDVVVSANAHHHSNISLPQHQYVNVSNDNIMPLSGNKVTCIHQPGLVPNYEEPWDLKEGQQKLNVLLKQAQNKHMKRPSFDNACQNAIPTVKVTIDKLCDTKLKNAYVSNTVAETTWSDSVNMIKHSPLDNGLLENVHLPTGVRKLSNCAVKPDSCTQAVSPQKIDVTIPLEKQIFYHEAIKRSAAEKMLSSLKQGSYLVRKSESNKDDYSLTLSGFNGVAMHLKIAHQPDGKYILGENSPPFAFIPEIVDYYTRHQLPLQNAGSDGICLIYPIHR